MSNNGHALHFFPSFFKSPLTSSLFIFLFFHSDAELSFSPFPRAAAAAQYVLENIAKLLNVLRDCNTAIRWLMLQRTARAKKIRELICASTSADAVLLLLLNTAQARSGGHRERQSQHKNHRTDNSGIVSNIMHSFLLHTVRFFLVF
jgi:hypothetical protein